MARYRLRDYHHHGKGIESFLKSVGSEASDSARRQLEDFQSIKEDALEGFQEALQQLEEEDKEV